MNFVKNISRILAFSLVFVFACTEEFIDKPIQPGTESDASFRKTADGLQYTLNASYSVLSGNYWYQYHLNRLVLGNYRSDDAQAGGEDENDGIADYAVSDFNIFSTNSIFQEFWRTCYIGVHYANAVIEFAPAALENASVADAARINRYVAEAKTLRGFFYFELVKEYGDLPLVLDATSQSLRPRTNRLAIYDQIEKDLLEAAEVLPAANTIAAAEKGRMSSGSALAILAKAYIFRASLEQPEKYFNLSYETAKKVISSGQFALMPTYDALWKQSGDFSSEAIVEGGQPAEDGKGDIGYPGVFTGPRYYYNLVNGQLVKGSASAYGWGKNTPTQDFVDAFEKGDPRLNWTVYMQGDSANSGSSKPSEKFKMRLICFDHSATGYYLRKLDPNGYPYNGQNHLNLKYYRYADLILIGAEAANEVGKTGDALAWLELVRARARKTRAARNHENDVIPGVPVQITAGSQDELRTIIRNERRVELGLEDHRFYDLVRWDGTGGFNWKLAIEQAQRKVGPNYQIDSDDKSGQPRKPHVVIVESKHKLGPIPDVEIRTSGNTLSQNEGY
jgi:starch-binding outer membrane protein, SusD/RagB family